MGSKFQLVPLEDVVSIHDAKRKPITKSDRKSGPYPYYGASDIADYIDDYIFDGVYLLLSEDGDNLRTRNTPIAFIANGKFWVNNHAHVLQGEDELDTLFLCYALQHAEIDSYISGSTRPKITQSDLKKIPVYAPNIQIRRKIAKFIKSFDDKITLNRQINQTLEQMALALFKSWFVDFDPVVDNALDAGFFEQKSDLPEELLRRAEQRKIVREQPDFKPLPAETRLLFPAAFEECEEPSLGLGGWVPKGWDLGHLSDIAGYGSKRVDVLNLTVDNYISTENMLPDRKGVQPASNLPTLNSVPAYTNRYVLISNIRPYFKKIWLASGYGGYSNDVLGFESKSVGGECFLFNLLSQDVFFDFMMATSKGSKMPRGDKKAILNWGIVIPPLPLSKSFSENVSDFYESITHRNNECNILSQLRDTLLPKLISGALRLNDDGTLASSNTDC